MGVDSSVFEKVRKAALMIGSDSEAERHNASDLIFKICGQKEMSVDKGFSGAFGSIDGDELKQLREQLEEAHEALEEAHRTSDELADALRGANAELAAVRGVPSNTMSALWNRLWTRPQTNLIVGFALLAWRFWLGSVALQHGAHESRWHYLLWVGIAYTVWTWLKMEFAANREGTVVLKGLIIAFFVYKAAGFYGDMREPVDVEERASLLYSSIGWLAVGCFLTVTNLCRAVAHDLANAQNMLFKLLRRIFA